MILGDETWRTTVDCNRSPQQHVSVCYRIVQNTAQDFKPVQHSKGRHTTGKLLKNIT